MAFLSRIKFAVIAAASVFAVQAQAATISVVSGNAVGITAPTFVDRDAPSTSTGAIQFFNEISGLVLTERLQIAPGTDASSFLEIGVELDSHLVFLNPDGNDPVTTNAVLSFSETIIGVIKGTLLLGRSNDLLGGATAYEPFDTSIPRLDRKSIVGLNNNDIAQVSGNQLTLTLNTTEPGDWMRVLTVAAPTVGLPLTAVPLPAAGLLLPFGLAGLAMMRRRKSRKA